jgi:CBS domain-containing protein
MFSIYGVNGPVFRGPMEELKRVSRTLGLARVRRIDPVREHMLDVDSQGAQPLGQHPVKGAGNAVVQQARSEYARVQQPAVVARRPLRSVADVMSARVLSVPDTATLQQAWQAMADAGVGQAPVVNAQGRLVGLLTRAELLSLERLPSPDTPALAWRAWLMQPASQVMLSPVPGVTPDIDIRRVAQVLLDTEFPGLPVVDAQDQLLGFVSRTDILKAIVHDPPLDLWS